MSSGKGWAVGVQALHKDLKDANNDSEEIEAVLDSKEMVALLEKDTLNLREESEGSDDQMEEVDWEESEKAPSVDDIYYEEAYPKVGRLRKKYKCKDYSDMVPPGGPRRSGRLKGFKQSKLPSFVDLECESA